MNEDKRKKLAIVRAILCILVIVIVILGWIEIIPKTIGMIISTIILLQWSYCQKSPQPYIEKSLCPCMCP